VPLGTGPGGPAPNDQPGARAGAVGRSLAVGLENRAGLRSAVVLAELLAPPVSLR